MKKFGIIITSFVLTFTVQLSIAENISDNYANGDTLTVTTMNNIKSAVNSKQDKLSGSVCVAGQVVQSIAADGTTTCVADSTEIAAGAVGTSEIADGSIVNADISALAAIAASKISGDVGFDFLTSFTTVPINTNDAALKNMGSITITAPAAGHIIAYLSGYAVFFADGKTLAVGLGDSGTALDTDIVLGNLDGVATERYEVPFSHVGVFTVTSAGSVQIFALAQGNTTFGNGLVNVVPRTLVGVFMPKRY